MPRNVRNFWMTGNVDGRKTRLAAGPAAKDGGLVATFKQRDDGVVTTALIVDAHAFDDGRLRLRVIDGHGNIVHEHTTYR